MCAICIGGQVTHKLLNIVRGCWLKDNERILLATAPVICIRAVCISLSVWKIYVNHNESDCDTEQSGVPGGKILASGERPKLSFSVTSWRVYHTKCQMNGGMSMKSDSYRHC